MARPASGIPAGYWSPEGLSMVAQLINDENNRRESQQELADISKLSAGTLKNLRSNDGNKIRSCPDPNTLRQLAPHIANSETGLKFLPGELIAVATGAIRIEMQDTVHNIPSLQSFLDDFLVRMDITLEAVSMSCMVPMPILEAFVENPHSMDATNVSKIVILLGHVVGDPVYLAQLAGLDLAVG